MSNNIIFQTTPLVERSFLQRIFGQYSVENALLEFNNLLAQKPIKSVSKEMLQEIEGRYEISLSLEYPLNLEEFYAVYLNHCLKDKMLSDEEINELDHLKSLLSLSDKVVGALNAMIGQSVYKAAVTEVIADGKITDPERSFLEKLETDLKLPKDLVDKINEEIKGNAIQQLYSQISDDRQISPEEEKELYNLSKNLGIELKFDDKSSFHLQKLKQYWALENLDLKSIETDISLQKSEICYFKSGYINWYEPRARRQDNYSAFAMDKSTPNFYATNSTYCNTTQLSLIDKGSFYLTNKRIIFVGQNKTSNIRLDKILSIRSYLDGFELLKETGKNPVLQIGNGADVVSILIHRLKKEN